MIDLPHIASRAFGTPLMIARAKLETILGVLGPRLAGTALTPIEPMVDPPPRTSITVERIAVVSVVGTLVSRSGWLDAASGLVSYAEIGEAIAAAMADPTVHGVVFDVDSAGGEVGGLFDLVEQIAAVKAASGKPLWAVANESALSAPTRSRARRTGSTSPVPGRSARSAWSRSMSTRAEPTPRRASPGPSCSPEAAR